MDKKSIKKIGIFSFLFLVISSGLSSSGFSQLKTPTTATTTLTNSLAIDEFFEEEFPPELVGNTFYDCDTILQDWERDVYPISWKWERLFCSVAYAADADTISKGTLTTAELKEAIESLEHVVNQLQTDQALQGTRSGQEALVTARQLVLYLQDYVEGRINGPKIELADLTSKDGGAVFGRYNPNNHTLYINHALLVSFRKYRTISSRVWIKVLLHEFDHSLNTKIDSNGRRVFTKTSIGLETSAEVIDHIYDALAPQKSRIVYPRNPILRGRATPDVQYWQDYLKKTTAAAVASQPFVKGLLEEVEAAEKVVEALRRGDDSTARRIALLDHSEGQEIVAINPTASIDQLERLNVGEKLVFPNGIFLRDESGVTRRVPLNSNQIQLGRQYLKDERGNSYFFLVTEKDLKRLAPYSVKLGETTGVPSRTFLIQLPNTQPDIGPILPSGDQRPSLVTPEALIPAQKSRIPILPPSGGTGIGSASPTGGTSNLGADTSTTSGASINPGTSGTQESREGGDGSTGGGAQQPAAKPTDEQRIADALRGVGGNPEGTQFVPKERTNSIHGGNDGAPAEISSSPPPEKSTSENSARASSEAVDANDTRTTTIEAGATKESIIARGIASIENKQPLLTTKDAAEVRFKNQSQSDPTQIQITSDQAEAPGTAVVDNQLNQTVATGQITDATSSGISKATQSLDSNILGGVNSVQVADAQASRCAQGAISGQACNDLNTGGFNVANACAPDFSPVVNNETCSGGYICQFQGTLTVPGTCPLGLVAKPLTVSEYACVQPSGGCVRQGVDSTALVCAGDQALQDLQNRITITTTRPLDSGPSTSICTEKPTLSLPLLSSTSFLEGLSSKSTSTPPAPLCQAGYHLGDCHINSAADFGYNCVADQPVNPCTATGSKLISSIGSDSCCGF